MRERENKSQYFDRLKKEIKNRETLRNIYNTTFHEVLNRFNGKVYNKRFVNALNEELQKISPLICAKSQEMGKEPYSNYCELYIVEVQILHYNEKNNYTDKEALFINVVLDKDYRIDKEKSLTEKYTVAWGENFDKETEEEKGILKNYNNFLKVAQKMAEAVELYNKLPLRFRANMDLQYLRIY